MITANAEDFPSCPKCGSRPCWHKNKNGKYIFHCSSVECGFETPEMGSFIEADSKWRELCRVETR